MLDTQIVYLTNCVCVNVTTPRRVISQKSQKQQFVVLLSIKTKYIVATTVVK
jgi:hypothetical protein